MRRALGSGIFIIIMLLIDFYVFQAVKLVTQQLSPRMKWVVYGLYWSVTVVAVLLFVFNSYIHFEQWPKIFRVYFFAILFGLFISKFIAAIIFLADDLRRILHWSGGKLYYTVLKNQAFAENGISRSAFMSWLGLGLGTTLFGTLLTGFTNKYRYQLRNIPIQFDELPQGFKGLKIVQISDIHSGSFTDKSAVERGVDMILKQEPDLILFTGDLVNDAATEMEDFMDSFSRLQAPLGVYSILGNHDYGDYKQWPSKEAKTENLERLKKVHADLGWRLLLNEHVPLERNGDQMALIGIENWGAKGNFSKYGNLSKAYEGAEKYAFKILMSHDPSHWDAEVTPKFKDIHLTLSGHTHGMQFGVEIPGFRWSPVQYMYRKWAGLYTHESQKLYINRGFGFLGYPGRVGIMPEITVIELL